MISAGIPITILIFTPIFLKEKIKLKVWVGATISIIGVILLIQGKQTASPERSILGEIEILLSCAA
jgi:drug/metabolite transporter (DMT)-like permease